MRLSLIALFVAPLIAVATAAVPHAAAMGTIAKRDEPKCFPPATSCEKSEECCDHDCKEAGIEGGDKTCGVSFHTRRYSSGTDFLNFKGCYFPLNEPCFVDIGDLCCQGKCVPNSDDPTTGTCKVSFCRVDVCSSTHFDYVVVKICLEIGRASCRERV